MKKKLDTKIKLSSHQVLAALREKMFAGDAWAWLTEVRNGTGHSRAARSADALAVSCWPSRGLFASGIEVKVSRSDWKRELLAPAKSDEVQRFCKHWWIATSPGIVMPEELPPTWGLVETDGKTCSVIKVAPELEHGEPTWLFVASVLRNAAKISEQALSRARCDGHASGVKRADEIIELNRIKHHELRELDAIKSDLANKRRAIENFRELTGIQIGTWYDKEAAKLIKTAALLKCLDLPTLVESMERNALNLSKAGAALRELEMAAKCTDKAAE